MASMTVLDDVARRRVRAFASVAVLAAAGVIVLYALAVHTGRGQRLDDIAFAGRSAASPATTHRTDRLLGSVTHTSLALLGLALCAVAIARRRVRLAVLVAMALAGSVATAEVLKRAVFDRPLLHAAPTDLRANSFPSGHATIGMSLALGLVVVVAHRWRWLASIAAALVAALFGTAVLTSGWHRPSDTVAAFLVSLAWYCGLMAVLVPLHLDALGWGPRCRWPWSSACGPRACTPSATRSVTSWCRASSTWPAWASSLCSTS